MIKERQRKRIERRIKRIGEKIKILRPEINEYNEITKNKSEVLETIGVYYSNISSVNIEKRKDETIVRNRNEGIIVPYSEINKEIKINDFIILNEFEYQIDNIHNNRGLYFEMALRRLRRVD